MNQFSNDSMRQPIGVVEEKDLDGEITYSGNYGLELILDCHLCDKTAFTKKSIKKYFKKLVPLLKMQAGDQYFQRFSEHISTAIQFILTSNITVHTDTSMKEDYKVFVNIFSCKDFDTGIAKTFTQEWFKAKLVGSHLIYRH